MDYLRQLVSESQKCHWEESGGPILKATNLERNIFLLGFRFNDLFLDVESHVSSCFQTPSRAARTSHEVLSTGGVVTVENHKPSLSEIDTSANEIGSEPAKE